MALRARPRHVKRYSDIARLLVKHARKEMAASAALQSEFGTYDDSAITLGADVQEDAALLAADLEALGPTFIKLGQLLATRADLLPAPYLDALSRLQDAVEPFSFAEVERIVEDELGVRISRAFSHFEATPVAAASLGQVHRATLRDGRMVAVKVQRPNIREQVREDMDALMAMAELLDAHTEVGKRYHFAAMLEQFRLSLMRELDYREEAHNLAAIGANLERFERIIVPRPVSDYTTSRVLTMDWVAGRSVRSLGPLALMEVDGEALLDELFAAYLQQVLDDGFFHADPHPGNVFIADDGRLALLDLGMVAHVQPDMQDLLVKLLLAVADGRGDDAATAARRMGEERSNYDDERFRNNVSALVVEHQHATLDRLSAGSVLVQITRVAGECGLRPAPELAMLARALLSLDQVARLLNSSFDPNAAVRRHAADVMRGRLLHSATPGAAFSAALDARDFVTRLPGRVNDIIDRLSTGEFEIRVRAFDERELMKGVQKIANRVTTGLILSALVVGAALMMRVQTSARLFGYPALAVVAFVLAAVGALALVAIILINDERGR